MNRAQIAVSITIALRVVATAVLYEIAIQLLYIRRSHEGVNFLHIPQN